MNSTQPVIVVTDLDGTLLDHDSYRFDAALPALTHLKQHKIPLVLSSSKTAAEMLVLREELDNHDPFVVENGAGIYLPAGQAYEKVGFGIDRNKILDELQRLRERHGWTFTGFNDMSVDDVMAKTGLSQERAALAKQRDYIEPLQWQHDEQQLGCFREELARHDLTAVQGGRFISISGKVDKGQALGWLREHYRQQYQSPPLMVALGDSENDRAMLENADYAILVRSPAHAFPVIHAAHERKTTEYGPAGWNDTLLELLHDITTNR